MTGRGMNTRRTHHGQVDEWTPGPSIMMAWNVAGILLSIGGLWLFLALYAVTHGGSGEFEFSGGDILGALGITTVLVAIMFAAHELMHGLAMKRYGAQPTYGGGILARILPYFYCTARGHRFTKRQFLVVSLAPAVVLNAFFTVAIFWMPGGGWLILPAALHLGGCIGDFWMVGVLMRKPDDMRFEDMVTGIRFHDENSTTTTRHSEPVGEESYAER